MENFLQDRIYKLNPRAPVGGILNSGWKVSATNQISNRLKANDAGEKEIEFHLLHWMLLATMERLRM